MREKLLCLVVLGGGLGAAPAAAQAPVYQRESPVGLKVDGFYRREWTNNLFSGDDQKRWRFQLRPRLEIHAGALELGVGGDFNHSDSDNTKPPEGETTLRLQRDNFASRNARLDLAFGRLEPFSWLRLSGGRLAMPLLLTEMIWDRDVRVQGGEIALRARDRGGFGELGVAGLASRGGHVFDDTGVNTVMVAGFLQRGRLDLQASFIRFTDLEGMDPSLIRQNSRSPTGGYLYDRYDVIDLVARLHRDEGASTELVVDYAWNRAAETDNRGVWLRLRLGSITLARGLLEYTYADVDRDATLAAYATDDFIWSTGWQGHRGELAVRATDNSSVHLTAQWQRFKASPIPEERDHWVQRYRIDLRIAY